MRNPHATHGYGYLIVPCILFGLMSNYFSSDAEAIALTNPSKSEVGFYFSYGALLLIPAWTVMFFWCVKGTYVWPDEVRDEAEDAKITWLAMSPKERREAARHAELRNIGLALFISQMNKKP